jgi:hypothetical protein
MASVQYGADPGDDCMDTVRHALELTVAAPLAGAWSPRVWAQEVVSRAWSEIASRLDPPPEALARATVAREVACCLQPVRTLRLIGPPPGWAGCGRPEWTVAEVAAGYGRQDPELQLAFRDVSARVYADMAEAGIDTPRFIDVAVRAWLEAEERTRRG